MENGEWRMENGEWKIENGEWKIEKLFISNLRSMRFAFA